MDNNFDFSKLNLNLPEVEWPTMPELNVKVPDFRNELENITKANLEKYRREVENNESLKALVEHNEDISRYNRELVSLNEKILSKINSLDDTLTFLNVALSEKANKDNENSEKQLTLLLELITIIENKDSSKLEAFMSNVGAPVAVGLLIEALKIKFGLG